MLVFLDGPHLGSVDFGCKGKGDGPAARAQVECPRLGMRIGDELVYSQLCDEFRFRSGYEHAWADMQFEMPEWCFAGEMLEWNPCGAFVGERANAIRAFCVNRVAENCERLHAAT